jgi:uncharacterized protein (TIGR03067 family)
MRAFLVATALLLPVSDAWPEGPKATDDARAVLGKWQVTSATQGGALLPGLQDMRIEFTAATLAMHVAVNGKHEPFVAAKYKLDTTKTPRAIDLIIELDPNRPIIQPGIYQIQGDELKLCLEAAGLLRPTKFESARDSTANLFVLKRIK